MLIKIKMEYNFYTYITANPSGVLYIWMTNNLLRRITEHKEWKLEGFTKKYNCNKLVYFEYTKYIYNAIAREKELKWWNRKKKIRLIETLNPAWKDLYNELIV